MERDYANSLVQAVGLDLSASILAGMGRSSSDADFLCAGIRRRGPPLPFGQRHIVRNISICRSSHHAPELVGFQNGSAKVIEIHDRANGN